MLTIYHNTRCSKSHHCLAILKQQTVPYKIHYYLDDKLKAEQIIALLTKLEYEPLELIRTKEPIWQTFFATKGMSNQAIIQAMVDFPILIKRPILETDEHAIIALSSDVIDAFLGDSN